MSNFGLQSNTNLFSNQMTDPSTQATQNSNIFSNNQSKPNGLFGGAMLGNVNQNQNVHPNTGASQNNTSFGGLIHSSNMNNQTNNNNPTMTTPIKTNNSTNSSTNIFGTIPTNNNSNNLFGNQNNQNPTQTIFNNNGTNNSVIFNNNNNTSVTNQINQNANGLFNGNQNKDQKSTFNIGQTQPTNNSSSTAIDSIFNSNPTGTSSTNNSLFGQNHQQNNSTTNHSQNTLQVTGLFSTSTNTQQNQSSSQSTLLNNNSSNQSTLLTQNNKATLGGGLFTQNSNTNPLDQQTTGLNIINNASQNTQPTTQPSLFSNSLANQNKENTTLTGLNQQPADLFSKNSSTGAGSSFQSNPTTSLLGTTKTDNPVGGLFTSITQGPTTQTANLTTENKPQFITAPSNILGINLDTLSDSVKKAYKSESKSIKDFIQDVEKDFHKDDNREYYRKFPKDIYTTFNNGSHGIEEFHERQRHLNHRYVKQSKEKVSEFDFYQNYPIHNHKSPLSSYQRENHSFIHTKRFKSPESQKNYNFNKNMIEISLKVRNNMGPSFGSLLKSTSNLQNNENISDNVITDSSLIDLSERYEIPNGANNKDKVIEIFVELKQEESNIILPFNINKNNKVSLLKELLVEKLKQRDESCYQSLKIKNVILIKHNTFMKDSKLISQYDLANGDKITLVISKNDKNDDDNNGLGKNEIQKSEKIHFKDIKKKNEIAPMESLPILTKPDYKTSPDYMVICRMTPNELSNVDNFFIWNEFGKIKWKEKVDLTKLDLDDIVDIKHCFITVYQGKTKRPPKGEGLNKPMIFTLKQIKPEQEVETEKDKMEFQNLLRSLVEEQGGKFIKYENQELVFECHELK